MITSISWIAGAVLLYGLKLIGEKRLVGLYVALAAEVLWIVWGLATGAGALVAMSLVICVMYVRAIRLWGQS